MVQRAAASENAGGEGACKTAIGTLKDVKGAAIAERFIERVFFADELEDIQRRTA